MSQPRLSVVILARNEARDIGRCLASVAWCDEVVVVDDHSQDTTVEIARAWGARVCSHRFESFAQQRNWALDFADLRNPWVLMLDADEALTPVVQREILLALSEPDASVAGFLMCRKTMFLGRWLRHADGFPVWIMRLVHRDRARFVDAGHGEVPAPPVDGVLKKIPEPFLHYPFGKGLSHWLARHNTYSTREAEMERDSPPEWGWRDLVARDAPRRRRSLRNMARRLPLRPLLRFCHHYFWKRGFLDGRAGLAFSFLMAGYEAAIVLKRWEAELPAAEPTPTVVQPRWRKSEEPARVLPR